MSTENGVISRVPDGYHTRSQAAALIGKSRDTLKRWHNNGTYEATEYMEAGKLQVWLYSDDDISKLKEIAENISPGRRYQKETTP